MGVRMLVQRIARKGPTLSATARTIGLVFAVLMLLFSGYMYRATGDWVALVFVLGSLGYIAFFVSALRS